MKRIAAMSHRKSANIKKKEQRMNEVATTKMKWGYKKTGAQNRGYLAP